MAAVWGLLLRKTGRYVELDFQGETLRLRNQFRSLNTEYEALTLGLFRRLLAPGDVVWDVGANIGLFTLCAGCGVGPAGRVVSWEPSPSTYEILVDHIQSNALADRCQPIQAAVTAGTGPGTVPFLADDEPDASVRRLVADPTSGRVAIEVPAASLDQWAQRLGRPPNLIKIDIEGAEVMALRGAAELMAPAGPRPVLLVAVHPQFLGEFGDRPAELTDLARARQYRTYRVDGQAADPVEYAEYLWLPQQRTAEVLPRVFLAGFTS
jgi:FkbM family methyltransferase